MLSETSENRGWGVAALITLGLAFVVTATPLYPEALRSGVMNVFSFVCHQIPDRSPDLAGVQTAVCHRCLGIYWALPVAAVVYRLGKSLSFLLKFRPLTIVVLAGLPAAIDWAGDVLGWWINTPASRMITGSIFGLAAGYLLADGIADIVRRRREAKNKT